MNEIQSSSDRSPLWNPVKHWVVPQIKLVVQSYFHFLKLTKYGLSQLHGSKTCSKRRFDEVEPLWRSFDLIHWFQSVVTKQKVIRKKREKQQPQLPHLNILLNLLRKRFFTNKEKKPTSAPSPLFQRTTRERHHKQRNRQLQHRVVKYDPVTYPRYYPPDRKSS